MFYLFQFANVAAKSFCFLSVVTSFRLLFCSHRKDGVHVANAWMMSDNKQITKTWSCVQQSRVCCIRKPRTTVLVDYKNRRRILRMVLILCMWCVCFNWTHCYHFWATTFCCHLMMTHCGQKAADLRFWNDTSNYACNKIQKYVTAFFYKTYIDLFPRKKWAYTLWTTAIRETLLCTKYYWSQNVQETSALMLTIHSRFSRPYAMTVSAGNATKYFTLWLVCNNRNHNSNLIFISNFFAYKRYNWWSHLRNDTRQHVVLTTFVT